MNLQKKFFGIEIWRYLLGVLSVGCITSAYHFSNLEKENRLSKERTVESRRESIGNLELYQISPKFNASLEDLGRIINSYKEKEALVNYNNQGKVEDVVVEERDTNSDGLADLVTYYSSEQKARWPVIAINRDSKEYEGLIEKFGEGIKIVNKK